MVQIPTTERQFYNTERKLNTLAAYAGDLLKPAEQAGKLAAQYENIKMDNFTTKARLELDNLTQDWRKKNQANPKNVEALKDLETQYQEKLNLYREQIDPMSRLQWDSTANKMIGAYKSSNNSWGEQQLFNNTKLYVAENIKNNLDIARTHGQQNNLLGGLADFTNSYKSLLNYAKDGMGEMDAKILLNDYEKKYMESYISGLADTNPAAAMEALKVPEITRSLGSAEAENKLTSIVRKQMAVHEFNSKMEQFNNEKKLNEELDKLPPSDALHLLEDSRDNVSKKFYAAREKSLLSAKGITAETRADTAQDIILDIATLDISNPVDYLNAANEILAKIEMKYSEGELSTSDRKSLVKQIYKEQGRQLPVLNEDTTGGFMGLGYSYKDAHNYIKDNISNPAYESRAMLDYFRLVNEQDLGVLSRQKAIKEIVKNYNGKILSIPHFSKVEDLQKSGLKSGDKFFLNGRLATVK